MGSFISAIVGNCPERVCIQMIGRPWDYIGLLALIQLDPGCVYVWDHRACVQLRPRVLAPCWRWLVLNAKVQWHGMDNLHQEHILYIL